MLNHLLDRARHYLYTILLLVVSSLSAAQTAPSSADILLIAPKNPVTVEFQALLAQQLPDHKITLIQPAKLNPEATQGISYIVTLGQKSLQAAQKQPLAIPTIATYLSQYNPAHAPNKAPWITPLYTSATLEHQITLAQQLLPTAQTIGVIVSERSQKQLKALEALAQKHQLKLAYEYWDGKSSLPKLLDQLLRDADYLLALEDPQIYNRLTIKTILLSSYRKNKVVIGPNPSFVKAGSLATCSCSIDEVVNAISATINGSKPPTDHQVLHCHAIKINEHVAKSLSIMIPDKLQAMKHPDHNEVSQ